MRADVSVMLLYGPVVHFSDIESILANCPGCPLCRLEARLDHRTHGSTLVYHVSLVSGSKGNYGGSYILNTQWIIKGDQRFPLGQIVCVESMLLIV